MENRLAMENSNRNLTRNDGHATRTAHFRHSSGGLPRRTLSLLAVIALLTSACTMAPTLDGKPGSTPNPLYTLSNLHPDEARSRLYAVNYQMAGLIPVCSQIEVIARSRNQMKFRVVDTNRTYSYAFHRSAAEPFTAHLMRYFGPDCGRGTIDSLSALDKKGIKQGQALVGMSKTGVRIAMGVPPRHQTPDLERNQWRYWRNRFVTLVVVFDEQGKVSEIK